MSDDVGGRFVLLDNQVVDANRLPLGRVDDVELDISGPVPRVSGLCVGTQALGERLGGRLGGALAAISRRLREPEDELAVIDPGLVEHLSPMIRLRVPFEQLDEIASAERWLSRHVISKLPGAGDAPQ